MPDVNHVLAAFRQELVDAGLVRRASVAGPLPPMIVEPLEGPPAPGELDEDLPPDDGLVLSLLHGGDLSEGPFPHERQAILDVHYRSKTAGDLRRVAALDAAVGSRLIRPENNYGYGFDLGAGGTAPVRAIGIAIWGGLGPLNRSKSTGYHHIAKYLVAVER